MATAPELLASGQEAIRAMRDADVPEVVTIERASYQFPWSEGIFRDCLRVGYTCRVAAIGRQVAGYGVMSVGAGRRTFSTSASARRSAAAGWARGC